MIETLSVPTKDELISELKKIDRSPPLPWNHTDMWLYSINTGIPAQLDVRLQCTPEYWQLHTGDAQYDNDIHGVWGATEVPFLRDPTGTEFNPDDTADDLLNQIENSPWTDP